MYSSNTACDSLLVLPEMSEDDVKKLFERITNFSLDHLETITQKDLDDWLRLDPFTVTTTFRTNE